MKTCGFSQFNSGSDKFRELPWIIMHKSWTKHPVCYHARFSTQQNFENHLDACSLPQHHRQPRKHSIIRHRALKHQQSHCSAATLQRLELNNVVNATNNFVYDGKSINLCGSSYTTISSIWLFINEINSEVLQQETKSKTDKHKPCTVDLTISIYTKCLSVSHWTIAFVTINVAARTKFKQDALFRCDEWLRKHIHGRFRWISHSWQHETSQNWMREITLYSSWELVTARLPADHHQQSNSGS